MLQSFQARMRPVFRRERCEVCNSVLVRNNDHQVVRFCSKICRRFRHNVRKLLGG